MKKKGLEAAPSGEKEEKPPKEAWEGKPLPMSCRCWIRAASTPCSRAFYRRARTCS